MLSAANQQLIRREQRLPALSLLLDSESLAPEIATLLTTSEELRCQLRYLRYKPGRRCVALYDVESADGTDLVVATAMTDSSWNHWKDKLERHPCSMAVTAVDHCRLRLERFPYDRTLRHVAKLFDLESRSRLLRRILRHTTAASSGESCEIELLAYKPARRLVAAVGFGGQPQFAVKFHASKAFCETARRAQFVRSLRFPLLPEAHCCDRYHALATAWVPGDNLMDRLGNQQQPVSLSTIQEVGRMLADLHACPLPAMNRMPTRDLATTVSGLHRLAADLAFLYPPLAESVHELTRQIVARSDTNAPLGIIHGDFYAKQVIVSDDSVQFIDFDQTCIGDPWQDVGNFVAKLYWSELRGQLSAVCRDSTIHAFLSGYREQRSWNEERFRTQLASGLLRCMPHTFRQALGDWPRHLSALLSQTNEFLCARTRDAPLAPSQRSVKSPCHDSLPSTTTVRRALCHSATSLDAALAEKPLMRCTVVRHKSGRRAILDLKFGDDSARRSGAAGNGHDVLGKIRFKGLDRRTPELHQKLLRAGFDHDARFRVPKFLGVVPSLNMWLQEKIQASTVTCDRTSPIAHHGAAAEAIAAFHHIEIQVDRTHDVSDELTILHARLRDVSARNVDWADRITAVRTRCDKLAAALPATKPCLIHRDYYFDQLLVDAGQTTLLDLDLVTMGPAVLDVGNYIAHLLETGIRIPARAHYASRAADAFISSYRRANPAVHPDAIAAWTMISLARHVWISSQIQGRQHVTLKLLECLTSPETPVDELLRATC
jgi:Ser/Thr protein kinase RdoA (MazF antagonist)